MTTKPNSPKDMDMMKVSRSLFTDGIPFPSEVFTRMPSGQFLCIGRKGDPANLSSLHLISEKNADIYVKKDDYAHIIAYNLNIIGRTVKNESVSAFTKVSLICGVTESAISDLTERGVFVGSYEKCRQLTNFIQDTTAQIQDFNKFLDIFNKMPGDLVTHTLATTIISLLVAEQMNITMKSTLEKIAMGALLHDVGMKEIPRDLVLKPRLEWTETEQNLYESHTLRGVEILRGVKEIPSDVLAIVLEHHENSLGMGFPRHLRDIKINPLARIVAVSDCFVDLIYDHRREGEQRTPEEAIHFIEFGMGQPFNKPAFIALKQLLHVTNLQKKIASNG
jgi:putative nucleotidyltransferase with HDIG domain